MNSNDKIFVITANIDDMTGENFGFLINLLMEKGAVDVTYTPAFGKKNRPLYILTVMTKEDKKDSIIKNIFKYSSTAGIRIREEERIIMGREIVKAETSCGNVDVKHLFYEDVNKFYPEWDDCAALSEKSGKSPADIYSEAMSSALGGKYEK